MAGKGCMTLFAPTVLQSKHKNQIWVNSKEAHEKSAPKKDVYQLFAEKVRDNKQLESRWAIMQETRVEYFRRKVFNTFVKNHPEVREILGPDKDLEVEDIVNTLLTKNLVIRCDRVMKTTTAVDFKPYIGPIYNAILGRLVNQDQDQEVKECAISCMSLVVSTFGDGLERELPACLPILVDRM
ncbi:hypothetical protein ACJX0J_041913, partial [Zea mays]